MALNPSPQRQAVVTFPTPNINDILFFETVDADRIGTEVPEYGTKHPDYKKWPDHRLVHVEAADDQNRYYRYYYVADQIEQDDDNWSYTEADIGGTKFDAVTRNYVIRRSEFSSTTPEMGSTMPDVPSGKFTGTHVLAERKQIPINDKILNGLYVIEQRTYVKKVPLTRLDFDEFFKTTNETKQILYYRGEVPDGETSSIETLADNQDNDYWGMDSGTVRTVQQLSDNWFAVTEQEVVKCESSEFGDDLQGEARKSILDSIEGKTTSDLNLFSTYQAGFGIVPNLVRNTDCWAHNIKGITGFVAWNSRVTQGQQKQIGGVAITPRHILYTSHAQYYDGRLEWDDIPPDFETGDTVYFCSRTGEVYSRRIVCAQSHPNAAGSNWDYSVALLDYDLPPAIEVVKVLPKDGYQYFQTDEFNNNAEWSTPTTAAEEVLVLTTDQDENAHIRKIKNLQFGNFDYDNPDADSSYRQFTLSPATGYTAWQENVVVGDSGSLACMVVDGECVLLGLLSNFGVASEPRGAFFGAPNNFKALNDLITSVDVEYAALTAAQSTLTDYTSVGYQLKPIDLSMGYNSYRPEEGVGETFVPNVCARLRYETVVTYAFPPILSGVEFDVWNQRTGASKTYPRVLYTKGAFRGPCRAVVDISWSTEQPVGIPAGEKPEPEAIQIKNPLFDLSIPPTLHGAVNFRVSVNGDETWEDTGAVYTKNATNVVSWKPHVISSEVKPFRGGWLMETVTVHPPS
jgi:hypothetical protein